MDAFVNVLKDNPLLLLFLVAAIGYPIGQLRIGGTSLGVAAVLFTGLAFGALDPELRIPEQIYQLGLVLFVYTIGLASGAVFFASLNRKGLRYIFLVTGGLLLAAALTIGVHYLFQLNGPLTAGLYAGSLTNTPALAGIIVHVQSAGLGEPALSEPVVAYSLTYPGGVLGMILVLYVFQKVWKVNYTQDARRLPEYSSGMDPIRSRTVRINHSTGQSVADLVQHNGWNAVFGRLRRGAETRLVSGQTRLEAGDLVTLVGTEEELDTVTLALGTAEVEEHLEFDLSYYDRRRIFVSSPQVVGRHLRELNIIGRYGAIVTRIRRGDNELIPHGETVLMPGDQIRVLVPHDRAPELTSLFGDSYRAVSEIDILTFSLGLALGLLVGLIPIPLPGGFTLELGLAGGPLIVALVLGALGRTGPLVWTLPLGANLTLRQIGLVLLLAGIGTRAGYSFFSTLAEGSGLALLAAGAAVTLITTIVTVLIGYKLLGIPMGLLLGILAGMQTQPAVLGYAQEQTGNDLPNIGYATVYPVTMILKILLAQALLILFL